MSDGYAHGYSAAEQIRLERQASILAPFIHDGVSFPAGSRILEAGCGVGAQTVELARRSPQATFIAIDRSVESVATARMRVSERGHDNVEFHVADIVRLPFADREFDGAFLCFVIEHLSDAAAVFAELRRVLKPAARIHTFEGDHGSVLASPPDASIDRLVQAVATHQSLSGGDAYTGRRLCAMLIAAGFRDVRVEPCIAYADVTRQAWVDGFTRATFIDMMRVQRDAIVERGLIDAVAWEQGIQALERTTRSDGSFCYTFFRGAALR
jgi:SAM-dependent methyltransferase